MTLLYIGIVWGVVGLFVMDHLIEKGYLKENPKLSSLFLISCIFGPITFMVFILVGLLTIFGFFDNIDDTNDANDITDDEK